MSVRRLLGKPEAVHRPLFDLIVFVPPQLTVQQSPYRFRATSSYCHVCQPAKPFLAGTACPADFEVYIRSEYLVPLLSNLESRVSSLLVHYSPAPPPSGQ
ncbi:hypothetical protein KP509_27G015700 [Ceratopteris richardii]|uniref:Uncharacterized protein n=1 Tax=Ceratopteris richardii TaxID=49495 RepID=A0A8T2RGP7_CERRI|nr:hypothetical protein KP509_27G015700 [Ceratopteris richardii]